MGNYISCKIVGVGTIKIRMQNGTVRTSKKKKKKSYFVGCSEIQCLHVEGRVRKSCKNAKIVVKGKQKYRSNSLYSLLGDVVISNAAIASEESSCDATKLSYMIWDI